ncbi:MAG: QueT transporter family protein [Christensenellales bacterium]|jgi:uncharacterized membrane protein
MYVKRLVQGALIAAIYAALTLLLAPISYGLMQIRVSEALCVLPLFTPAAVPGLFVGCLLANIIGGMGIYDVVIGSLATLVAAVLTLLLKKRSPWLAPLPTIIVNAFAVGAMLCYLVGVGESFLVCALYVGAGELIACYVLGMPLYYGLKKLDPEVFN